MLTLSAGFGLLCRIWILAAGRHMPRRMRLSQRVLAACGQLGHGDLSSQPRPKQIEALRDRKVVAISAGGMHSAAVVDGGELYTWGNSSYGQLGRGALVMAAGIIAEPARVTVGPPVGPPLLVKAVSCGGMHTAAITPEGGVYCWGRADSGQLALSGKRAVDVACGGFHTVVVMEAGEVYTWGKEDHGQLGCSKQGLLTGGLSVPHLVTLGRPRLQSEGGASEGSAVTISSEKACMVACGGWHTIVMSRDGVPWACGRGEYGRLGMGNEASKSTPEALPLWQRQPGQPAPARVTHLGLGGSHTLLLTEDNTVYSFGRAEEGRLGLSAADTKLAAMVPAPVTALDDWKSTGYRVTQLSAGGNHSAALLALADDTTSILPPAT
ncbi:regulator of chromosome condensation 1/beta-lactamase-inhibitor protein II [Tribonema minus]|uniref:Regulator of chromosome condensation 1/beta-lactamase-inhibitor protein II n=1 Tax=Tribonema minus TaxID=303371 RepID=A0A836CAY0_9STRA|nr:regulator of chromosome condensation 1/beta-lactamase-inhibitor protein II [Tribonema minus]